ncbi:hypothetical protein ACHWQZ_G008482 [Mnemiopsis leidyi]
MESIASSALEILPKKKKRRKENPYKDPNINHHRHVLQQSALAHRTAPSFSTKEKLEEAKKQLDEAYTTATKQDLLGFCNEALVNGKVPDAWTTASIIPIPKKGDLSKPGNYRGISLALVAAKIFNKLLLNRIYPHVDPLLRPNQNGFRKGRSTLPQILALRRIIEECRIGKKSAAIVFVDFSKAFDSINRDALFHILSLYGIPAPIIKAIRLLYDSAKSRVQTSDGLTEFFETLMGVLQGDTLAPFLLS